MALVGSITAIKSQAAPSHLFDAALAYLQQALSAGTPVSDRIFALKEGQTERVELGAGLFALEQAYRSKPRSEGRFESHLAYIDMQAIVSGSELMELTDIARLRVQEDFTPDRDLIFYDDFADGSLLRMQAGEVAIFYPVDAHMPSLAWGESVLVRKTVVKVPVRA